MPAYSGSGNFTFNVAKQNQMLVSADASYWNWLDDNTDGTGRLYVRLMVSDQATPDDISASDMLILPDQLTVDDVTGLSTKMEEYTGTNYPSTRPSIPALDAAAINTVDDEADISATAGATGEIEYASLGPATNFTNNGSVRGLLVCYRVGVSQSTANDFPVSWLETSSVIGSNGTGAAYTISWPTLFTTMADA